MTATVNIRTIVGVVLVLLVSSVIVSSEMSLCKNSICYIGNVRGTSMKLEIRLLRKIYEYRVSESFIDYVKIKYGPTVVSEVKPGIWKSVCSFENSRMHILYPGLFVRKESLNKLYITDCLFPFEEDLTEFSMRYDLNFHNCSSVCKVYRWTYIFRESTIESRLKYDSLLKADDNSYLTPFIIKFGDESSRGSVEIYGKSKDSDEWVEVYDERREMGIFGEIKELFKDFTRGPFCNSNANIPCVGFYGISVFLLVVSLIMVLISRFHIVYRRLKIED